MLLALRVRPITLLCQGFATKMQAGVTKNNKDSHSKRLGIKHFGGEWVGYNKILVRQRGFKWRPGANVFIGRDHTIHSASDGFVYHQWDAMLHRTIVNVVPAKEPVKRHLRKRVFCYHPELLPELAKFNPKPTNYVIRQKKPKPLKEKETYYGTLTQKVAYREVVEEKNTEEQTKE